MKYAFIDSGILRDVIMTDPKIIFNPGYAEKFSEVPDECETGWMFDGETFSPPPVPPVPVPAEVEGWQAEVAMRATPVPTDPAKSVWDRVQEIIAAMADGIEKITALTVLQRGKIRRDSPMLAQLAPLVPLDQEQVDDLLRLADSIKA